MRSYLYKILLCILICVSGICSIAHATDDPDEINNNKIIIRKANFVFHFINEGPVKEVTVEAFYNTGLRIYSVIIKGTAKPDTVDFTDPINISYFRIKLNDAFNKANGLEGDNQKVIENQTTLSVFHWVYSMKGDKDDQPRSGDLHLKHHIMVFESADDAEEYDRDVKNNILNGVDDSVSWHKYKVNAAEQKLKSEIDVVLKEKIKEFKSINKDTSAFINTAKALADLNEAIQSVNKRVAEKNSKDSALREAMKDAIEMEELEKKLNEQLKEIINNKRESSKTADSSENAAKYDEKQNKKSLEIKAADGEAAKIKSRISTLNGEISSIEKVNDSLNMVNKRSAYNKFKEDSTKLRTYIIDTESIHAFRNQYSIPGYKMSEPLKKIYPDLDTTLTAYQKAIDAYVTNGKSYYTQNVFPIKNITLKIERGFIEDIHVAVDNGHGGIDFYDNIFPIGISSIKNLKSYQNMRLYIRKDGYNNLIYLSDVLGEYELWEELLTRDYSPGDTVINKIDPSKYPYITLMRERSIYLFDSRIYTDLAGLSEKAPNGLVQLEVSRRFNFQTNRQQWGGLRGDRGFFNYIYFYGTLSKIEQKLKRLPLQNAYVVSNNTIISPNYVTNLDLRRYENASLETSLNIFLTNWKDGKSIFYLDIGTRYGHTPVTDTVKNLNLNGQLQLPVIGDRTDFDAHTITFILPRIRFEFLAERRVGFGFSYQYNLTYLFSNSRFKQVFSEEKSDLTATSIEKQARKSHQFDFDMRILTSHKDNDHIFFRSRFFIQQGDVNKFFPQIQLGYNHNLIFKK